MEAEMERLKRDKSVLMMEVVRLRHQQHASRKQMHTMGQRVQANEHRRHQQMMTFLARAMRNRTFLSQLAQKNQEDVAMRDGIPPIFHRSIISQTFGVKGNHPCQDVEHIQISAYVSPKSIQVSLERVGSPQKQRRDIWVFFKGKMEIHPKNISGRIYNKRLLFPATISCDTHLAYGFFHGTVNILCGDYDNHIMCQDLHALKQVGMEYWAR